MSLAFGASSGTASDTMAATEKVFALVDGNSFYASCERVFRPELRNRPTVVLASNDGAIIARSPEAKALGIKMGVPYFEVRKQLEHWNVAVFSSNFALYGDLSQRMMAVIESLVPGTTECYSIDEIFCTLSGVPDPEAVGRQIRHEVQQRTGLPVGVGISTTKTLAKLANYAAKRWQQQTGGVVDLRDPSKREKLLKAVAVEEVWGVGRRMTEHLKAMNIHTAWDLAGADPWTLRKRFSVVIEKTARELRGVSCLGLEEVAQPRQEICCSRSFGKRLTTLPAIKEAVATYAARATERLRGQQSLCKKLRISIRTGMFNPNEPQIARGVLVELPHFTDDTRLIVRGAIEGLEQLYREGYAYAKAEVLLMDLRQRGQFTDDLFATTQPEASERLMGVMDQINQRWGRGTLRPGRVPADPDWGMRRDMLSPSYTTRLDQLWVVKCE